MANALVQGSFQLSYLISPSGGLLYHVAALRYRRSLWAPFIKGLNDWLITEWNPSAEELIVFGSSAGWTLEERFLRRFKKVIAVEPDPLARFAFRKRFPSTAIDGIARSDLLPWSNARPEGFGEFLRGRPKAAVLFSNLLGQIALHRHANLAADRRQYFHEALAGRDWASYHDLYSARCRPVSMAPVRYQSAQDVDADEIASGAFEANGRLDVVDHDTFWLLRNREWLSIPWRLGPEQTHLVACVRA